MLKIEKGMSFEDIVARAVKELKYSEKLFPKYYCRICKEELIPKQTWSIRRMYAEDFVCKRCYRKEQKKLRNKDVK